MSGGPVRPTGDPREGDANGRGSIVRGCAGALFLAAAYFAFDPVEGAVFDPLARAFGLHTIAHGELRLIPYGILMSVRIVLDLLIVAGVLAILRRPWSGFPLTGPRMGASTVAGLAIGLLVMTGAIVAIVAAGAGTAAVSAQPAAAAGLHGVGWLAFDYIGAAGEELYGRVAALMVAQRLFGRAGAVLASGLMFSALHLGNPGADRIWLVRLFLQGALLAYAVYRTGSIWWSVGYHTGWNWASAPLFGAAGSGYLDQGHILDFSPTGSAWITGGAVGPEGSVFAFVAVVCAAVLLTASTRTERIRSPVRPGSGAPVEAGRDPDLADGRRSA